MFVFLTTEHTEAHGIYGRNACKRGTGISHEAQSLRFFLILSGFAASRKEETEQEPFRIFFS